jgi:hypothetical protein
MWPLFNAGNDLRSHTLSRAVPSALRGLTSVFGMGTGGTPAVRSPTNRSRQHSALSIQSLIGCADFARLMRGNLSKIILTKTEDDASQLNRLVFTDHWPLATDH